MSAASRHPSAPKKPVLPHECVLLFGIPLTRSALEKKLIGVRDGSFTDSYRASSPETTWIGYSSVARQMSSLADEAERMGVRVVRAPRLEDIMTACDAAAVTVVSHWRSARFHPADLIDVDRIWKICRECRKGEEQPDADRIVEWLNLDFPPEPRGPQLSLGAAICYQEVLASHRRTITLQVPEAFRGGPGVEFPNGFEEIETIAAQVPSTFTGVFDLTICNSLLLAESIHQRAPRSLVLATSDKTYPETRLPVYQALLRLLATGKFAYEDAMSYIQTQLRKEFQ